MYYYWVVYSLTKAANKYLDMFVLSYTSFKRMGIFKDTDTLILLCDEDTEKRASVLQCIKDVKRIIVPKPKNHLEGMLYRYRLHKYYPIGVGAQCVSLDVDLLCIRPFRVSCPENTLLAYPEGSPKDTNYCGDMTLNSPHGCSATFFSYTFSPLIKCLLEAVDGTKEYYTVDGPYYNKALDIYQTNVKYLPTDMISFNGNNHWDKAVLLNLCGDPGDENLHWSKMLDFFINTEKKVPEMNIRELYVEPKKMSRLGDIFTKYGSDKDTRHNYADIYESLFRHLKNKSVSLFEMGLGTNDTSIPCNMGEQGKPGASLRAWRDWFSNPQCFGADIDPKSLFQEYRITTFQTNQLDVAHMKQCFEQLPNFDIIIDDGLHTLEANTKMISVALPRLKPGGYYVVEDLYNTTIPQWRDIMKNSKFPFEINYQILELAHPTMKNHIDNNLLIIHRLP